MESLQVTAGILLCQGRLLLATRRPGTHLAGLWEFPGGKVECGETLENCISRELQEELGLVVLEPRLAFRVTHVYPQKTVQLFFLRCDCQPGTEPVGREGQQAGWFLPSEIPPTMVPADRAVLECLERGDWTSEDNGQPDRIVCLDAELTGQLADWLRQGNRKNGIAL